MTRDDQIRYKLGIETSRFDNTLLVAVPAVCLALFVVMAVVGPTPWNKRHADSVAAKGRK